MKESSISVLGRFTVMVVAAESFAAGAAFCARTGFVVCEARMLEKSTAKQTKRIVFNGSSLMNFLQNSTFRFVLGSYGKASPSAERFLTDLQHGSGLLALVFTALDHAND